MVKKNKMKNSEKIQLKRIKKNWISKFNKNKEEENNKFEDKLKRHNESKLIYKTKTNSSSHMLKNVWNNGMIMERPYILSLNT